MPSVSQLMPGVGRAAEVCCGGLETGTREGMVPALPVVWPLTRQSPQVSYVYRTVEKMTEEGLMHVRDLVLNGWGLLA